MKKIIFETIISKYLINDEIDSVLITVEDNVIKIPFKAKSGSPVGYIQYDNFDVKELEFGVYNHTNLLKNIKIMADDFDIEQNGEVLTLKDDSLTIEYISQMRETIDYINQIPEIYDMDNEQFDVVYIFDKEFISSFLKISSVDKYDIQDTFTLKENKKDNTKFELKIGKLSKIKFNIICNRITETEINIITGVLDFMNIFSKNKDCIEGYMYLKDGLIRLYFINSENIQSTYFIPTHTREH